MERILFAVAAVAFWVLMSSITGCGNGGDKPSVQPLPAEYRVLAENLAIGTEKSRNDIQDNKEISQIISEAHATVLALRGIQSGDSELNYIAAQGQSAVSEIVSRLERVNSLPKPPSAGALFVESAIHGFYGNFITPYIQGADADEKQKAMIAEVQALISAVERVDAVQMMLPTIAKKYAASPSSATGRIVADIDESWGGFGPDDWLSLHNTGPGLADCTIEVVLTGATGQIRKNVHFIRTWQKNTSIHAKYEPGQDILGKRLGRITVSEIKNATINIWSPEFTTTILYIYRGKEKDKDIARYCSKLSFEGRYQPFQKTLLWDTQRACYFTLNGIAYTPKCEAQVMFRKGKQSKGWCWEFDSWGDGEEKRFGTNEGELTFDPKAIDLTLSFPGTSYKHKVTLPVDD